MHKAANTHRKKRRYGTHAREHAMASVLIHRECRPGRHTHEQLRAKSQPTLDRCTSRPVSANNLPPCPAFPDFGARVRARRLRDAVGVPIGLEPPQV
eukprot:2644514-Pleurochrysis_carterae.AAC.1